MSSKIKVQSSRFAAEDCGKRIGRKNSSCISHPSSFADGFTLLELIITLTVLAILIMGTLPLAQNAAKRQKELRLREDLRMMRAAIDDFHRDTVGACPQGAITTGNPTILNGGGANVPADPRSRVVIDDCTIFDNENLDRFPPTLDVLVEGVKIKPRGLSVQLQNGRPFDDKNATDLNSTEEVLKVYLREIPVDPITGEKNWQFRSSYQAGDSEGWDEINVFDVRSSSDAEAMNGEKYSDW